jgi:hypothetical protein
MHIELQRTFGHYIEPQAEDGDIDWHQYFSSNRRRLNWDDLHEKRVTVVLGEAGIGKTAELKLHAERMKAAGRFAFFLPLNTLATDSWELALENMLLPFQTWLNSAEDGFFFLDAVDEARLETHRDFQHAIAAVRTALAPNLAHARIVISSRVTDWTVPDVQKTVAKYLLEPVRQAISLVRARTLAPEGKVQGDEGTSLQSESREELNVVTLDALSKEDAHRCAEYYKLEDEVGFWSAVEEGDYEFMASRPLDLQWMVKLWNQRKVLGTYAELIEANVIERLREPNDLYHHARRSLAEARLREGATELAAAMEFGNVPFIAVRQASAIEGRILDTFDVLRTWEPSEVQLLLSTAIFDEASFDRVKFHHRSVREYLAAQWVSARLTQSVPLSRLEPLFASRPNDELTLIPSRRPVLAWLAAINVRVRSWVVSNFPDILLHEGDPQTWDQHSADQAFKSIVGAAETRVRLSNWFKSTGEYLRISRALSPGQVAAVLNNPKASPQSRSIAYRLARHGKLKDCADAAFEIYRGRARFEWETTAALAVLEVVGTPSHREQVLADIESGVLTTNELIAAALPCVTWSMFSPARLATIFDRTHSEGDHGTGPMAAALRRNILPEVDLASATLLLQAVLLSLPRPLPGQRFEWYPSGNQPERAWLLHVLPHCLLRVLELTTKVDAVTLPTILEAAEKITGLRHTGFSNQEETKRVRAAISILPELRWKIALAISKVKDLQRPVDRLVWDEWSIVRFCSEDLAELTRRSHELSVSALERELWFEVGVEVAIRLPNGRARAVALRGLRGPKDSPRSSAVFERLKGWHQNGRLQRAWEAKERARKAQEENERIQSQAKFVAKRSGIIDGSDAESLLQLVSLAHSNSGWDDNEGVKLDVLASYMGQEVTALFSTGLKAYWRRVTPANPSNFPNGQVPGKALATLAGVTLTVADGVEFTSLPAEEVAAAAQIAVWALPGPPPWFVPLFEARPIEVATALNPWVLAELQDEQPGTGIRGAFVLAMHCPAHIRRPLLEGATHLVLQSAVKNIAVLMQVVPALFEDGLMSQAEYDTVCLSHLELTSDTTSTLDFAWFRLWATGRPSTAWDWFKKRLSTSDADRERQSRNFAMAMAHLEWIRKPWDSEAVSLLLEIAEVLRENDSATEVGFTAENRFYGPPIKHMLYAIAKGLVDVPGIAGRNALLTMLASETNSERRSDLLDFLQEHAEHEASVGQRWSVERLRRLHLAFDSEPQNEAQLFEQVVARLEEVRTLLEKGPFSERRLFNANTPEKHLQLWLAAKFLDTQNRRFSVHREEEVDNDKKTDIQLSCRFGNVCVEIKPVDADRGYSANSLTDTLRTQIVEQYLKGYNSSRGILVLMQLDKKTWDIPDGEKGQLFEALVTYLKKQAQLIKQTSPNVDELTVFPMRCVI